MLFPIHVTYFNFYLSLSLFFLSSLGQSVPHVHVHIIPRKSLEEFAPRDNDAIYQELEEQHLDAAIEELGSRTSCSSSGVHHHLPVDSERVSRREEDMAAEALELRKLFPLQSY